MRLQATYNVPSFKRLLSNFTRRYENVFRAGLQAYMSTILAEVPVYSGESRASLAKAAELVGVPIFITPAAGAPNREARGRSRGDATLDISRATYSFTIESNVIQLQINDIINVNTAYPQYFRLRNPGPYRLGQKGAAAFEAEVRGKLRGVEFRIGSRRLTSGR